MLILKQPKVIAGGNLSQSQGGEQRSQLESKNLSHVGGAREYSKQEVSHETKTLEAQWQVEKHGLRHIEVVVPEWRMRQEWSGQSRLLSDSLPDTWDHWNGLKEFTFLFAPSRIPPSYRPQNP